MEHSYHLPVLMQPVLDALQVKPDGVYVDGTAGGGGHSFAIASRLTTGRLIALDQDPDAIREASRRLAGLPAEVVQSNFADMDRVLAESPAWTVFCWILGCRPISWTRPNADFRIIMMRRWICG